MDSSELDLADVDVNGLRKLYKSDSAARLVLDGFAGRQNRMNVTTVGSLHSPLKLAGNDIERKDIVRVFKELERLNCGKYISGKTTGGPNLQSKFLWKVHLVSVGKAATDKKLR
jgi:hypothetical protein